jgi:alpha-ketoglutarate-dependent taurine dioxygenase
MVVSTPLDKKGIPIVISPSNQSERSMGFLKKYVTENKDKLETIRKQKGAILFRGFDVLTAQDFEDLALLLHPKLSDGYFGITARTPITKYTYTSTELPRYFPIPQHTELSYMKNRPKILFFYCLYPPERNGETPICDMATVAEKLDPEVKKQFQDRQGIMYYRNYKGPSSKKGWLDVKRWNDIFNTTDKKEVERICKEQEMQIEWSDVDHLRIITKFPAIKNHPETGVPVWYNQLVSFHPAGNLREVYHIAKDRAIIIFWLMFILGRIFSILTALFRKFGLGYSYDKHEVYAYYGDGTVIDMKEVNKVQDCIWENMVFFKWQKSDVIMLDNDRISHGRMPFRGKRKVICALGI